MKLFQEVNRNMPPLPEDRGMRYLLMARRITFYWSLKLRWLRWILTPIHMQFVALDMWYYRHIVEPRTRKST